MNSEFKPFDPQYPDRHGVPPRWDERGWRLLLEHQGSRLRRAVARVLSSYGEPRDPERIDDLLQEVWCRLLERGGPRGGSAGETTVFLRRVAERVVVDAIRRANAAKRRPREVVGMDDLFGAGCNLPDRRTCPERRAMARQQLRAYLGLCRELLGPRVDRNRMRVIRLALVVGLPSREIARRLGGGWTQTAIDSMLCRLRRRLLERGAPMPARALR